MTEEDVAQVFAGFSWGIRRALAMIRDTMFAKKGEIGEVEDSNPEKKRKKEAEVKKKNTVLPNNVKAE